MKIKDDGWEEEKEKNRKCGCVCGVNLWVGG